jgi:hypothetical protein
MFAGSSAAPQAPWHGLSAGARVELALVRVIVDEVDRALEASDQRRQSALRTQLAEQLERLARALREDDRAFDEPETGTKGRGIP